MKSGVVVLFVLFSALLLESLPDANLRKGGMLVLLSGLVLALPWLIRRQKPVADWKLITLIVISSSLYLWSVFARTSMSVTVSVVLDHALVVAALVLAFCAGNGLRSRHRRGALLAVSVSAIFCVPGFWFLTRYNPTDGSFVTWPLANPNHSGLLMAVGWYIAVRLLWPEPLRGTPRLRVLLALLLCTILLITPLPYAGSWSVLAALGLTLGFWLLRTVVQMGFIKPKIMSWYVAALPAVICGGVWSLSGFVDTAARRILIWKDTITGLLSDDLMSILFGRGWYHFAADYERYRSWDGKLAVTVLGPESEFVMFLYGAGIIGMLLLAPVAVKLCRSIARKPTGKQKFRRQVARDALLLIMIQAAVDNSLHTMPMLLLVFFLTGIATAREVVHGPGDQRPIDPPSTTSV